MVMDGFSPGVKEKLDHYVYRLIDPRNGQTFYVGRGQGDRLFAHVNEELRLEDGETPDSTKLETIRDIRRARLDVIHVVHRHGMCEEAVKEVEAALIDVFVGLTNVAPGKGTGRGPKNAEQLERDYARPILVEDGQRKLMYIKIHQSTVDEKGLYEAVRRSHPVNADRANRTDYVLAVVDQIVRGVFENCEWGPSKEPGYEDKSEFVGVEVIGGIADEYLEKRIPDAYHGPGMAGTIFYNYPWPITDESVARTGTVAGQGSL